MRILKQEIKKNGFTYRLKKRTYRVAWFEQFSSDGTFISNEIFRVLINQPCTLTNKKGEVVNIESGERFPSNEAFGVTAWSTRYEDKAEERFQYLVNNPSIKKSKTLD